MEETKEPPSSVGGETKKELHYEDGKSLPSDYERDEATSHKYEEVSIENIEDHLETHNTINFEEFDYFLNGYRCNNENVNSLRDNQQSTSLEEHEMRKNQPTCEKSLDTPL